MTERRSRSPPPREAVDTRTGDQVFKQDEFQGSPTLTTSQIVQQAIAGAARAPTGEVHIRGQHAEYTYYIDGVPVPPGISGSLNELFDPTIADQINFQTGSWDAEYGGRNVAVINVTTRIPSRRLPRERLELRRRLRRRRPDPHRQHQQRQVRLLLLRDPDRDRPAAGAGGRARRHGRLRRDHPRHGLQELQQLRPGRVRLREDAVLADRPRRHEPRRQLVAQPLPDAVRLRRPASSTTGSRTSTTS